MSNNNDNSEDEIIQTEKYASMDQRIMAAVERKRKQLEDTADSDIIWSKLESKWDNSEAKKEYEFKKDLVRGHSGEHSFYQKYQHLLSHLDGRNADFEINKTGETIELKTDYYDENLTDNLFIERYSYDDKNGGPWQSADKNITYYIYQFHSTGNMYCFNTKQLVKKMAKYAANLQLVPVKNKGYTTYGYKVNKQLLKDLVLEPEEIGLFTK